VGHPEGQHNYGLINGPDGARAAVHHNLFAHQKNRNPAVANGPAEIRNNVANDVRHGFVHHNPAAGPFNIVGNVYVRGPSAALYPFYFDDESDGASATLGHHLANNAVDDPGKFVGTVDDPWSKPSLHPTFADLYLPPGYYRSKPYDFASDHPGFVPVTTTSPDLARAQVLARAGAFPRDVVDTRLVAEVLARSGSWGVHAPADLLAGLTPTPPPPDADGITDGWEAAHELDPLDAADAGKVMPSGSRALEEYLDDLADGLIGEGPGGSSASSTSGSGGSSASGTSGSGGSSASGTSGAVEDEGSRRTDGCRCSTVGVSTRGRDAPLGAVTLLLGVLGRRAVSSRRRARRAS